MCSTDPQLTQKQQRTSVMTTTRHQLQVHLMLKATQWVSMLSLAITGFSHLQVYVCGTHISYHSSEQFLLYDCKGNSTKFFLSTNVTLQAAELKLKLHFS